MTGLLFLLALLAPPPPPSPPPPPPVVLPVPPALSPPPPPPQMSPPPIPVAPDRRPHVELVTDLGSIIIRLETAHAPLTAANFLRYVDAKRMNGFVFYRSTRNWGPASALIQAGNQKDARLNYPPIAHEATTKTGLTNCSGAIAMARLAPGTATSQFFLLLSDFPGFDADPGAAGDNQGYAVFGEIVAGRAVAQAILAAPVSATAGEGVMHGQLLTPPVTIRTARRVHAPVEAEKGCVVKAP